MTRAKFDGSKDQGATTETRPRWCTWCKGHPARSDMPWCESCYEHYRTMSVAQFNAWRKEHEPKRALPRQPGRIEGLKQIAQAMKPARDTVREWADQMGIGDGMAQDRAWRSQHGEPVFPGAGPEPDGRPEPPSQDD